MTDNRRYIYIWDQLVTYRPEYPFIERWIPANATVIDLGCGNGSLLRRLMNKQVTGIGFEMSPSGVDVCHRQGLDVRVGRIDEPLVGIADDMFDFAICNATLQMTMFPEVTLQEMKRVARNQIVSFPNFAFLFNRLELCLLGRMPRTMLGGYSWDTTGHIHQLSIRDFKERVASLGLTIQDTAYIGKLGRLAVLAPNLLAQVVIYRLNKSLPGH